MPPTPTPHPPAGDLPELIYRWYDIEYATGQSPWQRALVRASVDLANASGQDSRAGPVYRDGDWFRRVHYAYEQLRTLDPHADRERAPMPAATRCLADPAAIRAWLTGRSDQPGVSVAEQLGIGKHFHLDSVTLPGDLNNLVHSASRAGLFGPPGHQIELWIVTDDDQVVDGHLLTVDLPDGTRLASHHLPADHLLDYGADGVDAAVSALVNTAEVANELLDQHRARTAAAAPAVSAALAASSFSRHTAPATPALPGAAAGAVPGPSLWGGTHRGR